MNVMHLLDPILPPKVPNWTRLLLNGLFVFHVAAFLVYITVLIWSYVKNPHQRINFDDDDEPSEKKNKRKNKPKKNKDQTKNE